MSSRITLHRFNEHTSHQFTTPHHLNKHTSHHITLHCCSTSKSLNNWSCCLYITTKKVALLFVIANAWMSPVVSIRRQPFTGLLFYICHTFFKMVNWKKVYCTLLWWKLTLFLLQSIFNTGCPSPCTLAQFDKMLQKYKIPDWDKACGNTTPTTTSLPPLTEGISLIFTCAL